MKKLLAIVVLGLLLSGNTYAGWLSKELYVNCYFTEESGNDFFMIDIEDGNFCISMAAYNKCTKVDKFNSKEVKSIVLDPSNSSQASMFGEKIYWKINRKNGVAGLYSASNNKMVSEKIICKTRPGL